ncbi:hypothetical protein AWB68_04863 [Caballeronia choica]|uniref:DUF1643 domain-containing protein n=1 Tax=Caballeronia choica TaxID=326476 RepID=A0A158K613_9BURK|nr:hypothetical protein AWB68_04863 [Caballeronia choica]
MRHLTEKNLAGERGAQLSDCGSYRYRLWREWDTSRPTLAFLMLNPSTADHLNDDPTIAFGAFPERLRATLDGSTSPTFSHSVRPIRTRCSPTPTPWTTRCGQRRDPRPGRLRIDGHLRMGLASRRADARRRSDAPASHHRYDRQALPSWAQPGRQSEAPRICRGQHAASAICFPSGVGMRELVTTIGQQGG